MPVAVEPSPRPLPPSVVAGTTGVDEIEARVVAVGFSGSEGRWTLGLGADRAVRDLGVDPFELLDRADVSSTGGDAVSHELLGVGGPGRLLLVGLGKETLRDYRRAGAVITRRASGLATVATSIGSLADDDQLAAFVEGVVLGGYGFSRRSADDTPAAVTVTLTDLGPPRGRSKRTAIVEAAVTRAMASWRARSYALTPSNEKGPTQLEAWSREAAEAGGLDLEVWDEKRLAADGFGGILAVGRGSAYDSRLLRLEYAPAKAAKRVPHIVLVGKGITFDSGGLSIKPRVAMETMKRDMTGAAVVIAVLRALRDLSVKVRVTGLVASAENAVGAASMRPGDVVTHYGGRTSEVGNTDAEGRLVLADALAYAAEHIDATYVVDVATLTGAGKMALGTSLGALFANDDDLADSLVDAGELAGEPLWRLPLADDYEPLLSNTFADATNSAGGPGAITAALFLQHFVGSAPWAHLDIASVGDSPDDAFEYTKGATGFGARLLLRWLTSL
jgi:leucyl aminopeptidase